MYYLCKLFLKHDKNKRLLMELTAGKIAEILSGEVEGDKDATVTTFARIESGKPGAISFYANPKYEEMCRRFIADQSDFSEENILDAGIWKRFQNTDLDECVKEIVNYIKSMQ